MKELPWRVTRMPSSLLYKPIKVNYKDYGGSRVVIFLGRDHYIDVRKDIRKDRIEVAEVVSKGQVTRYVPLQEKNAPETLIQIIKDELC